MKVLHSRISDNRSEVFSVKTLIIVDGDKRYVVKEAVFPEGIPHIESVFSNQEMLSKAFPNIYISKTWLEDGKLYGEFIDGKLLSHYYVKLADRGDEKGVFDLFDWQIGLLTDDDNLCEFTLSDEFAHWFDRDCESLVGSPALRICNFDATAENVFILDDDFKKPCFIDYEWCFDFPIPLSLLKYHVIDLLYSRIDDLRHLIPADTFFCKYLDENEVRVCKKLRDSFLSKVCRLHNNVTADDIYARYLKDSRMVSIEDSVRNIEQLSHQFEITEAKLVENETKLAENAAKLAVNAAKLADNEKTINLLKNEKEAVWAEYNSIIHSRSWKATALLRKVAHAFRNMKIYIKERFPMPIYWIMIGTKRLLVGPNRKNIFRRAKECVCRKDDTGNTTVNNPVVRDEDSMAWINRTIHAYDKMQSVEIKLKGQIDIIIPVYNGYEYLEKLFDSITRTCLPYRVFVINDCSSDSRVKDFLLTVAANDTRVQIYDNKKNIGFVKSVNKGFSLAEHHVALLNTDIELPDMWLERLMFPIIADKTVASSTPFSNAATIFSFPDICIDNDMLAGFTLDDIDSEFKKMKPIYIEVPTGVGFCMGINIDALKDVGFFDDKSFGKGYGEENDWCQRAIVGGYRNVQVENLFVYHKHGGSFTSELKKRLIADHMRILSERYPRYNSDVGDFIHADPAEMYREWVKYKLITRNVEHVSLYFAHDLGGGAELYMRERIDHCAYDRHISIVIVCNSTTGIFRCEIVNGLLKSTFNFRTIDGFTMLIDRIDQIIINELVGYLDVRHTLQGIVSLSEKYSAPIEYLLHDYYCICPSVTLIDKDGRYCDLPSADICKKCAKQNRSFAIDFKDMKEWRDLWKSFFASCEKVVSFSEAATALFDHIYGGITNVDIVPHKSKSLRSIREQHSYVKDKITIGTIGAIGSHKGSRILTKMAEIAKINEDNVNFVIIGISSENLYLDNIIATGSYDVCDVPELVIKYDIDVLFIASIWPETFSYTTKESISLGLPVASFNIGAQAQHVRNYDRGILIDRISPVEAYSTIISYCRKNFGVDV
jgi:GT2 family glycosyltransferase